MTPSETFVSGAKNAARPTGIVVALIISVIGMLVAGVVPMAFGVGADDAHSFYGQLVMTSSFAVWIGLIFWWVKGREKRTLESMGFVRSAAARDLLIGSLAGLGLTSLVVGINAALGGATVAFTGGSMILPACILIIGFFIQASAEEIAYRGFLAQTMLRRWSVALVVGVQAVLFTLGHLGNGLNALAVVTMLAVSYLLMMWVLATGNLWGAMGFHALWNWSQANFWGAAVSNFTMDTHIMSYTPTKGWDLLSGGSFGLETSLLTICALIAGGIFFHVRWARGRRTQTV